jgi:hypothetical protein
VQEISVSAIDCHNVSVHDVAQASETAKREGKTMKMKEAVKSTTRRKMAPLVVVGVILSAASLAWTTWSLMDFLGTGFIGFTVAVGADLIWSAILWAEYKGIADGPGGKVGKWTVIGIGWLAVIAVVVLLVFHGLMRDSVPMATAGVLPPLGAKLVWTLVLIAAHDPAAPTPEQRKEINNLIRDTSHEAQLADAHRQQVRSEHADKLERIKMNAELTLAMEKADHDLNMARIDHDLEIDLSRDQKRRQIRNRQPLIISGETVPRPVIESGARAREGEQEGDSNGTELVPVDVTDLSEAQRKKKNLVALWVAARDQDGQLTQAEFCRRMDARQPYLSRALRDFPPQTLTEEEIAEAQTEAQRAM